MSRWRFYVILAGVCLLLQLAALAFLDDYLKPDTDVTRELVWQPRESSVRRASISVPEGIEQPAVSFDGAYASWVRNGKLVIASFETGKSLPGIPEFRNPDLYYRWLPDRNIVLYGVCSQGKATLSTYQIENGIEKAYPPIAGLKGESRIEDAALSPYTNLVYVKIKTEENHWAIYRIDIYDQVQKVLDTGEEPFIHLMNYSDTLFYSLGKKLLVRENNEEPITLELSGKAGILAIDRSDCLYRFETAEDKKLSGLYTGIRSSKGKFKWTAAAIPLPEAGVEIVVSPGGDLYGITPQTGLLRNLRTGNVLRTEGRWLTVQDGFAAALRKGCLELIPLE